MISLWSKGISSLLQHHNSKTSKKALSRLYGPTLTSIHDYRKNHSFDYMDLCWQSNVSVVMYGCENWTIKKAKHRRTDAFKLWCCRRLLRVPWTARSKLSILKEINPEYSLEGMMLKLKFQYFGHLMQRTNSLDKTLMLGKIEGGRRSG